ncbi:hypothetical protein RUND412_001218 [Rhizina undulata]
MSASIPESLEKQRLRLEDSLTKLRKALKHWQISSAEYEGFREELQALPVDASRDAMVRVLTGFDIEGTVLDETDIKSLLGDNTGIKKTVAQVIAAVGHRIDYAQDNVAKVEKQIETGTKKLESLQAVGDELTTEYGLPMMEIHEELDDDDNVISEELSVIDSSARAVSTTGLDSFEKFMKKEGARLAAEKKGAAKEENKITEASAKSTLPTQETYPAVSATEIKTTDYMDTEPINGTEDPMDLDEGGGIVKIIDDDAPKVKVEDDWVKEVPGETADEAELRRQMLKYNMQEIGAVVAELNLDEKGAYYGYEDDSDDDDEEDDLDEDEDQYGRTTSKVITEEYQREMEELAKRIKERGEAARAAEAKIREEEKAAPPPPKKKKGVRFAEELDISPVPPSFPEPASAQNTEDAIPLLVDLLEMDLKRKAEAAGVPEVPVKSKEKKPSIFKSGRVGAINDTPSPMAATTSIVESPVEQKVVPTTVLKTDVLECAPTTSSISVEPPSSQPKKLFRFKAAKLAAASAPEPMDVDDADDAPKRTVSNFIVERPVSENVIPAAPDELDPEFLRKEVATDFHRLRTRMIQREGGFVETEAEMARVPLDENGETRKVSRFKAARVKGLQATEP